MNTAQEALWTLSFIFLSVWVHACVLHVFGHICMCRHACTCVHMHMKGRGWSQISSLIALHFIYWGRVFHLNLQLTDSLVQLALGGSLSLPPKHRIIGKQPHLPGIYISAGNPNSSPHMCSKCFPQFTISPVPVIFNRSFIHRIDWWNHSLAIGN